MRGSERVSTLLLLLCCVGVWGCDPAMSAHVTPENNDVVVDVKTEGGPDTRAKLSSSSCTASGRFKVGGVCSTILSREERLGELS